METRRERVKVAFDSLKRARLIHKEQTEENALEQNLIFTKAKTKAQIEKCLNRCDLYINYSDISIFGNGLLITIR